MNIGILTFHRCINYGSYWQARCLAEGLKKHGYKVSIIDHHSIRVNNAEWRCALQPVLPTPVHRSDYPLYRKKINNFNQAFCELPLSEKIPLEHPEQMEDYDLVVVGSDEVWNLSHPWYGYYPIFYGEGIRAKRIVAYAASFGNYDVTWKPDQNWIDKLHRFDSISVRDENSQTIINNILGFKPEMVLDPCLQFPAELKNNEQHYAYPFLAVYGHNFSDYFISYIQKYARERKIPLISIGYRNDWADEQWITAGPLEFASFIEQSEAVVTNFFHGCVFAVLNSKPFVCETTPYRSHKIKDLMKKAGSENHMMNAYTPFNIYENKLNNPIDSHIHKNIALFREISNNYLNKALITYTVSSYENL
ncbi:MAG: polysaccharide pyruvyl transferase family protein [Bacteroidetes bacterium]|nr:polysaccharide pyruvyl transferase family protein [Bacteroidota bacterium]